MESLVESMPMRSVRKGTALYGPEGGPQALFLLKSGKVELYRQSCDGRNLTLAVYEPGSIFGEMSLVGLRLSGTYASAVEDSAVCALSPVFVRSLISTHPSVGLRIIDVLGRRLQQARDALEEMGFNDVTGRVAGLLLRLADRDTNVVEGYSHQELACMVGCLRESLTVTLDRFKGTEAVAIGRRRIELTDRAQLEQVVSQRSGILS